MPKPKRPLKVFLCHAHADRDAVRALYARLTKDGVDAWLDKEKLLPGQPWELEIPKAVRESDVVVVCLSCQFSEKGFRQKEVRIALEEAALQPEGEIFIIPARLEECDNLGSLGKWHWVDLFEDNGYEMLMRALQRRADKIGAVLQVQKDNKKEPKIKRRESPSIQRTRELENELRTKSEEKHVPGLSRRRTVAIAFIGLVIIIIAAFLISPLIENRTDLTPTPTVLSIPAESATVSTSTPIVVVTNTGLTPVASPTFTPTPENMVTAEPTVDQMTAILLSTMDEGKAPLRVTLDARKSYVKFFTGETAACGNTPFCSYDFAVYRDSKLVENISNNDGVLSYIFGAKGKYFVTVYVCRGESCSDDGVTVTVR